MTKINSVRRAFGLWCAFLAAGTWVLPMGVVVGPSSRATAAPLVAIPEGECDSIVVVFTAAEPTVEVEEFGKSIAAQGASAAPPALVVLSPVSQEVAEQLSAAALADGGQQGLNPVDPSGNPLPPPLKLPPGPGGKPNKWKPVQGTPARPIKWIPETPLSAPGGGQPGGSWDDEHGHWDVDNGLGDRVRVKPDGTLVGPDHEPAPGLELPSQFPGIDPAIAAQFACVAVVTLSITAGGLLIILIIWEFCSGVAWS